jgi:Zn-dependent M16 (insulinase) family peptidase
MSGQSPAAALSDRWDGFDAAVAFKALDRKLKDPAELVALAAKLEKIHQALLTAPREMVIVCEDGQSASVAESIGQHFASLPAVDPNAARLAPTIDPHVIKRGFVVNTPVSFCAKAFPAVPKDHADAPALTVLQHFLEPFLWAAIREEGGAYGARAIYDPDSAQFGYASWDDPRIRETLHDFDRAAEWVAKNPHTPAQLEEAILCTMRSIDAPHSPAGEALRAFTRSYHDIDPEFVRRFRAQVLEVTIADLQRVAATYLRSDRASTAVVSNASKLSNSKLGLSLTRM